MSSIVINGDTSGSVTLQAPTVAGSTVVTLPTVSMNIGTGGGSVATNTAFGASALAANTTGGGNSAFGLNALAANTTANQNSAFGTSALAATTTGLQNAGFGRSTLLANTTGSANTAIGTDALIANTTASNNTAVGYQAGYTNVTGAGNTFIGYQAGYTSAVSGNAYNTCIGVSAGTGLTTGTSNTFIGTSATASSSGALITTGSKNTIIGAYNGNQGSLDIRTASNYIVLSDGDGNPRAHNNGGSTWSFSGAGNAATIANFYNNGNSTPYGFYVQFSAASPNNTTNYFLACDDNVNTKCYIYSSGTVSNRTGTYNTISDAKLKENIVDATPKLDKLMQVKVRNYNLIGDELKQIGFVAQELEQVFPNLVEDCPDMERNEDGTYTALGTVTKNVKSSILIPFLVKAMQEQQALITTLTTRITALEAQVGA
jgi:hypothetical protein